jgi:hypothetical protein
MHIVKHFLNVTYLFNLVISGIKQKLLERGANTIGSLPRVFRSFPSFDGKSGVSGNDFFNALSSFGLGLRKEDNLILLKFLNKDNYDYVNFDDFLYAIRGKPNDERQAVIDLVYYKFDKNKTGYAEASDLRKVFNCTKHPKYLLGEYTEDQIFYLYLQNFSNEVKSSVTKKVLYIFIKPYRNGMNIMLEFQLLLMMILTSLNFLKINLKLNKF